MPTVTINGAGGADYTSISAAITGESSTTGALEFHLEGTTTDSTSVNITGMSCSSLLIKSNTSDRYKHESSAYADNFVVNQNNVTLEGFDIGKSGSGAKDINILRTTTSCTNLTINKMRIYRTGTWTSDGGNATLYIQEGSGTTIIRNCFIHDGLGRGILVSMNGGAACYIQNNTVKDAGGAGIESENNGGGSTIFALENNLVDGSGGNDYTLGVSPTVSNTNLSSDTTSPQTALRSKAISYHADGAPKLADSETDAIDAGTDLSGTFTDDYFGSTRTGTWDIGAYHKTGSSASVVPNNKYGHKTPYNKGYN